MVVRNKLDVDIEHLGCAESFSKIAAFFEVNHFLALGPVVLSDLKSEDARSGESSWQSSLFGMRAAACLPGSQTGPFRTAGKPAWYRTHSSAACEKGSFHPSRDR